MVYLVVDGGSEGSEVESWVIEACLEVAGRQQEVG
jgi:hypothetical protein